MNKTHMARYVAPSAIVLVVAALYGPFLENPIVFDDLYFFMPGAPEQFLASLGPYPRHLAYATLALGWKWFGPGLIGFRIVSLLIQALVGLALYVFLLEVHKTLLNGSKSPTEGRLVALLGALTFVAHPVAVYGAGYLIERSIVMATFFALASWTCFLRGVRTDDRRWLWLATFLYVLALLSKEHAVTAPAVSVALTVWWWRSQSPQEQLSKLARRVLAPLIVQGVFALLALLYVRGFLGRVYEIEGRGMLGAVSVEHAWPLSVMTQGWLFFKYIALWLLPGPQWMSVDMREPFANSFLSWPQLPGFIAFLLWPIASIWLLWKGGRKGLVGMGLLAPWLLFATELTTVRIQEIFVLYRSYLWLAPAFMLFLLLEPKVRPRVQIALVVCIPLLMYLLAWERLSTFEHPLLLWDDAARLVEGKTGLTGLERIYRNRGIYYARLGKRELAIDDYTRAIESNPNYSVAYYSRGVVQLELKRYAEALADFDQAIKLEPDRSNPYVGRAKALEGMGRLAEAKESYRIACNMGWKPSCANAQP